MNTKIKLFIGLVLAFVVTQIVSRSVFFAGTPRLNLSFFSKLKTATLALFKPKQTSNNQTAFKKLEQLPATALKPIGKGVYAQEDWSNKITYIRVTKDVEWEVVTIMVDGKQVKVQVPKGSLK